MKLNKLLTFPAVLLTLATPLASEETVITKEITTTTVISETDQDALVHAYNTLKLLDQKEMQLTGYLYAGVNPNQNNKPEYKLVVEGIRFRLELDDGRKVAKRAQECTEYNIYASALPKISNCLVTMTADVSTMFYNSVRFEAIGWDVEFK